MMLTEQQYRQVCEGAVRDYPMEAVWLLTARQGLVKVDNIADNPLTNFAVARAQMVWAMTQAGGLIGVIHSHPDGPAYPSGTDMVSQLACGVPYGIVVSGHDSAGGYIEFGMPLPDRAPLYDRPFRHGVTDCYGFVRDYYAAELGIDLPDFARAWSWWSDGGDLYVSNLKKAGFEEVARDSIRAGDMLLFSLRSDVPNHAAVYLGDEVMAHHIAAAEPYSESRRPVKAPVNIYMRYLYGAYRHKDG